VTRRFDGDELAGAVFDKTDLSGARFVEADLSGSHLRGVVLDGAVIDGSIEGLVVNGVDVEPLIEAELDRRHPERLLLRSTDPDELREAWRQAEATWAATTAEALARPEAHLRLQVDGEWSFLETLRHLAFASDSWIGAGVLGALSFDPIEMAGWWLDSAGAGLDVDADPSVDEVLRVRASRQAMVRDWLAGVTVAELEQTTLPDPSMLWPPQQPRTALSRLHVVLNEEWWHHRFVRRDMAQWPSSA
jgi:uncharacterized protein YjbI with pentapeptide repeats